MKTLPSVGLTLFTAFALVTHSAAQTWQTVDDYRHLGNLDGVAYAMTKDPSGNLYAAGYGQADGNYNTVGVIRKSSDGGTTWEEVDAFSNGETNPGFQYNAIASDAAGTLYAAADNFWATENRWIVRRSTDGGQTWLTVDDPVLGTLVSPRAVTTDAAGNVYVVGHAVQGGKRTWLVRKGEDGGSSWSTVDSYLLWTYASAHGVLCHPTAGIFVVGSGTASTASKGNKTTVQQYWYVRRSLDGGATWNTVDAYLGGGANAVGADSSGNVYAVGGNNGHWIVRKSSNGTSWETVDDFAPCFPVSTKPLRTQCYTAAAVGFASDSVGNLFVAGTASANYVKNWVVRKCVAGSSTWQTEDWFSYSSGPETETMAFGVITDDAANVLVGGMGSSEGNYHWLVRKRPAQQMPLRKSPAE